MRFTLTALVACFVLLFSTVARPHCEECPFPLAQMFGDWVSHESGFVLEVDGLRESKTQVIVGVVMKRLDNGVIVAQGRVVAQKDDRSVRVRLADRNGRNRFYVLGFNAGPNDLTMNNDNRVTTSSCERKSGCLRLRRLAPSTTEQRSTGSIGGTWAR